MKAQDRIELKGDGPVFYLGNVQVPEAEYRKVYPLPETGAGAAGLITFKPLASLSLKVHPDQVPEAREVARHKGVPVDFTPDGRPIFTSSRQMRRYAIAHGFRHQDY